MNLIDDIRQRVVRAVSELVADGVLPPELDLDAIIVEPPRDPAHGEIATNAGMVLSRQAGIKSRDIALALAARMRAGDRIATATVAGPGFLNLRLSPSAWRGVVRDILGAGGHYGKSGIGAGRRVSITCIRTQKEPQTDLSIARQAVFCSGLASLLRFAGYEVTEACEPSGPNSDPDALAELGVVARSAFSEEVSLATPRFKRALQTLRKNGLVRTLPVSSRSDQRAGAAVEALFDTPQRSEELGYQLRTNAGEWGVVASDIAAHADGLTRGSAIMISIHSPQAHGPAKAMQAVVSALSDGAGKLDLKRVNTVDLQGVVAVAVTATQTQSQLRGLLEMMGPDLLRFAFLARNHDMVLGLDAAKITTQSHSNSAFTVQYAHARAAGLLRRAGAAGIGIDDAALASADLGTLNQEEALAVLRRLAWWPGLIEIAARTQEPHRVIRYLAELAADFHCLWQAEGSVPVTQVGSIAEDAGTLAKIALARAVMVVIAAGLGILGIKPVEEMR